MQFSLKSLLALTTAVAVTIVSLLYPVPLIASAYFFGAVAAILVALIAVIQLRESRRAFAASFAVVAGGYLWLATPNSTTQLIQAQLGTPVAAIESPLLTTTLMYCCYEAYVADGAGDRSSGAWTSYPPRSIRRNTRGGSSGSLEAVLTPNLYSFLTIGHSALAIYFGWLGGCLGRRWQAARNKSQQDDFRYRR